MKPQEEALKLYQAIKSAQVEFDSHKFIDEVKESEVKFRHEAVRGMLIMARNEVWAMHNEWNEDLLK